LNSSPLLLLLLLSTLTTMAALLIYVSVRGYTMQSKERLSVRGTTVLNSVSATLVLRTICSYAEMIFTQILSTPSNTHLRLA
jgi:hypothetical protein